MALKAYYQGEVDRFCSVYAIINSIRLAAKRFHEFSFEEGCAFYEHMIRYLYDRGIFLDVLYHGTDMELMDDLLKTAQEYMLRTYNLRLLFRTPLRGKKPLLDRVCDLLGRYLKKENTSCIVRFYNGDVWDHWSVVERKCCHKLKLFDSYFYPHLHIHKSMWGEPFVNDGMNRFNQDGLILIKIVRGNEGNLHPKILPSS